MLRMASETPEQKINSKYTTTDTNEPSEIKLQQFKQTQRKSLDNNLSICTLLTNQVIIRSIWLQSLHITTISLPNSILQQDRKTDIDN